MDIIYPRTDNLIVIVCSNEGITTVVLARVYPIIRDCLYLRVLTAPDAYTIALPPFLFIPIFVVPTRRTAECPLPER